jgi:NAD(P)-dependent dehydrogenase (short-subunit alcohol dehydrogenase family)
MAPPFRDKIALVTGGASGIGAALARALGKQGADVTLADRQTARAEEVAASIRAAGGRATATELDVRDLASMKRVVSATAERAGRIDLFFNNAGIAVGGEIDSYSARDWDDVFDVNLRGVAYGVQTVYPVMIRQRSGHIVNTASMAGLVATPASANYSAAKHAVVGLTKCLRMEAKEHGVRASVLCPGAIATPILTGGEFGRFNVSGLTKERMLEIWSRARPMDVDVFAERVLRAVARNEAIIILPAWWKAFWYLDRISPALSMRLWSRVHARVRAELMADGVRPLAPGERA